MKLLASVASVIVIIFASTVFGGPAVTLSSPHYDATQCLKYVEGAASMAEYPEFSGGAGLVNSCNYSVAVLAAACQEIHDNKCDDSADASSWNASDLQYILPPAGTVDEHGNHLNTIQLANGL